MKKGRPKDIRKAKNRRHTVRLNERAEYIYQKICKQRGTKWIHDYLSEHLVHDFELDPKNYALFKILMLQKERDLIEDQIAGLAHKIEVLKKKERRSQETELKNKINDTIGRP